MIWLKTQHISTGQMNTKDFFSQSEIESVKTLYLPSLSQTTLSIFMLNLLILVQVVYYSNNSLKENELYPSTHAYLIQLNKKCLHSTENFVELSLPYKPMNTTLLAPVPDLSPLRPQTNSVPKGTQRTTLPPIFPLSSYHQKIPELEYHLDPWIKPCLPWYSQ